MPVYPLALRPHPMRYCWWGENEERGEVHEAVAELASSHPLRRIIPAPLDISFIQPPGAHLAFGGEGHIAVGGEEVARVVALGFGKFDVAQGVFAPGEVEVVVHKADGPVNATAWESTGKKPPLRAAWFVFVLQFLVQGVEGHFKVEVFALTDVGGVYYRRNGL